MGTVANQNTIKIHREKPKSDFLQIKNSNWQEAIKDLKDPYAFILYIYLSSNADGYTFGLSPADVKNATGMPRSTYYKKIKLLAQKGYITTNGKATLHFYERPQEQEEIESSLSYEINPQSAHLCDGIDFESQEQDNLQDGLTSSQEEQDCVSDNIEIDNNRNVIYNNRYNNTHQNSHSVPAGEFNF